MSDTYKNLWAPWRMEYIKQLCAEQATTPCFVCYARDHAGEDEATLVLHRGKTCLVIMNRFPYTSGHLLVAPYKHEGDINGLDDETLLEMMQLTKRFKNVLASVFRPDGYNIGINLDRCAGAGLPDHLHLHIVPRWRGDVNFMSVFADIRVIPETLTQQWARLHKAAQEIAE